MAASGPDPGREGAEAVVFKTLAVGIGGGFLGLAGAAITPVVVGILAAFGGAGVIVGFGAWRAFRKMRRQRRHREPLEVFTAPAVDAALPPPSSSR